MINQFYGQFKRGGIFSPTSNLDFPIFSLRKGTPPLLKLTKNLVTVDYMGSMRYEKPTRYLKKVKERNSLRKYDWKTKENAKVNWSTQCTTSLIIVITVISIFVKNPSHCDSQVWSIFWLWLVLVREIFENFGKRIELHKHIDSFRNKQTDLLKIFRRYKILLFKVTSRKTSLFD